MVTREPAGRTRKVQKKVYFSAVEWEMISRRMRGYHQTNFSQFARETLTTGLVTARPDKRLVAREIERQLGPIGNNINQLARQANTDDVATYAQVRAAVWMLGEVRRIVAMHLGSENGDHQNRADQVHP